MPTATECLHDNSRIDVEKAIELKEHARSSGSNEPLFMCVECKEHVRPHRGGGHASAHFEHLKRNPDCPLSHIFRNNRGSVSLVADYDIDDIEAIEGYEQDRDITFRTRNKNAIVQCKKRDNYTCQACGFRLESNGKFIIECHHTRPLAKYGVRKVLLNELIVHLKV